MFAIPMTRQRAGVTETQYGDKNIDWDHTDNLDFFGWLDSTPQAIRSKSISEHTARSGEMSTGTLYAPADLDIKSTDRVSIGGVLYQIDTVPAPFFRGVTGTISHLQMIVSRFRG